MRARFVAVGRCAARRAVRAGRRAGASARQLLGQPPDVRAHLRASASTCATCSTRRRSRPSRSAAGRRRRSSPPSGPRCAAAWRCASTAGRSRWRSPGPARSPSRAGRAGCARRASSCGCAPPCAAPRARADRRPHVRGPGRLEGRRRAARAAAPTCARACRRASRRASCAPTRSRCSRGRPTGAQATFAVRPGDGTRGRSARRRQRPDRDRTGRRDGFAGLLEDAAAGHGVLALLLLAAFGWGALHALSPGHGKAMVAAYLVGSRGTPRDAVALGATVTITHTIGVFALGLVALSLSAYVLPEDLYPWLNLVAGLMVVVVGAGVLRARLRERRGRGGGGHEHSHGPRARTATRTGPRTPTATRTRTGPRPRPHTGTRTARRTRTRTPTATHPTLTPAPTPTATLSPRAPRPALRARAHRARRLRRADPVPVGARRPARGDLPARDRARHAADRRVLARARRHADGARPRRGLDGGARRAAAALARGAAAAARLIPLVSAVAVLGVGVALTAQAVPSLV